MSEQSTAGVAARDIVYLTLPEGAMMARLYRPPGPGPFPALVSIHGGRWCAETRETNAVIDQALAASGILVLALDFRMPPAAQYPASLNDINFAIRWLKANAAALEVAPGPIGGLGASSGGHQIMLTALQPQAPAYTQHVLDIGAQGAAPDASLDYVVACWAVLDPLARYHMAKEKGMELHIRSHELYWPDEAAMAVGNPQRILQRAEQTHMPLALIIHGTGDSIVPCAMAERFVEQYRASGGTATFVTYADQPHTFILKSPDVPASQAALRAIVSFVASQAGLQNS